MNEEYAFIFYQKYIGKIYNKLQIESFYGLDKHKKPVFVCRCCCGGTRLASLNKLQQGRIKSCGCDAHGNSTVQVGEKYNSLLIEELLDELDSRNQCMCMCLCDCGNRKKVAAYDLTHGRVKSCGCKQHTYKDITGLRSGLLTAIRYIGTSNLSSRSALWLCKCDCGNFCEKPRQSLTSGTVKSCGCIKSSYGEKIVEEILKNKNIEYERDYKFLDCLSPNGFPVKFDFAIIENSNIMFLIEYQGKQHYEDCGNFGKLEREYTDKIKKEYCLNKNIDLLEIRFDEDPEKKINEFITCLASQSRAKL